MMLQQKPDGHMIELAKLDMLALACFLASQSCSAPGLASCWEKLHHSAGCSSSLVDAACLHAVPMLRSQDCHCASVQGLVQQL